MNTQFNPWTSALSGGLSDQSNNPFIAGLIKPDTSRGFSFPTVVKEPRAAALSIENSRNITPEDAEELRAVLFQEVGNRTGGKRAFEANIIANTALNRLELARQTDPTITLATILNQPAQYMTQGRNQYDKYKAGKANDLDKKKLDELAPTVDLAAKGQLKNDETTKGVYNFVHRTTPQGSVIIAKPSTKNRYDKGRFFSG